MPPAELTDFTGARPPRRENIHGRFVDLEPLDPAVHGDDLFAEVSAPAGIDERFRYLPQSPQTDRQDFDSWIAGAAGRTDPLFFAVVDRSTGRAVGRQALMRIDAGNGVMEVGHILWGPSLARTAAATEALFLTAELAFSTGFRRFEWKCDDENAPSKRAAERFGFTCEGVFRQHLVVKGRNRDTAWFSIIDSEWPALREGYRAWLDDSNFTADGRQRTSLREAIAAAQRA